MPGIVKRFYLRLFVARCIHDGFRYAVEAEAAEFERVRIHGHDPFLRLFILFERKTEV
jgi:hypothetical protein